MKTDFNFFKRPSDGKCLFFPQSEQGFKDRMPHIPENVLWTVFSLVYDIDYDTLTPQQQKEKIENIVEVLNFSN